MPSSSSSSGRGKAFVLNELCKLLLGDCNFLFECHSISYLFRLCLKFAGCKSNNVDIVYTMWSNLKKTPDMDVGQVGFHKQKEV